MPKTKQDKKRKNKVVAYSNKVKARQRRMKEEFLKTLQETHSKELASKVQETATGDVKDAEFNEFSIDSLEQESVLNESNDFNEFSLDNLPIVEQTSPLPDISGKM